MSGIIELARPEIRNLVPYSAASYASGLVRLNANETPWSAPGQPAAGTLNCYPPEKPVELTHQLAAWYGIEPERLLLTRGSSEAIDLVIRGFCRAGQDAVVVCPPTFGMYRVYAEIQGARVHEVPLLAEQRFALNADELVRNWPADGKILFICSPNNPTGNRFATDELLLIAKLLSGKALVVLDAAYAEFGEEDPTLELLNSSETNNIAVLRTLSKAFGLAGARCGALLGPGELIRMLGCVMPPYAIATPSIEAASAALRPSCHEELRIRVDAIRTERKRLMEILTAMPGIETVYPSEANFVMVKVKDSARLLELARQGGILIRDFSGALPGCLRITVGTKEQNNQLLQSLTTL